METHDYQSMRAHHTGACVKEGSLWLVETGCTSDGTWKTLRVSSFSARDGRRPTFSRAMVQQRLQAPSSSLKAVLLAAWFWREVVVAGTRVWTPGRCSCNMRSGRAELACGATSICAEANLHLGAGAATLRRPGVLHVPASSTCARLVLDNLTRPSRSSDLGDTATILKHSKTHLDTAPPRAVAANA
jgi:hypothetical protein